MKVRALDGREIEIGDPPPPAADVKVIAGAPPRERRVVACGACGEAIGHEWADRPMRPELVARAEQVHKDSCAPKS